MFGVAAFAHQRAPPHSRPNIIFILSDDHRWDALGAAGNTSIKTPTLDRLITNTQKVRAVVINGRHLDRNALDRLLAAAETVASKVP